MTTRRSPDGQIYTEVPVVPTHSQLGGRDVGDQHPIEAISGLQEALDGKVDARYGKGLSTEDYTVEEKEKLDGIEDGAEENRIETVKVNGAALTPDEDRAVDVRVPSYYVTSMSRRRDFITARRGDGYTIDVDLGNPVTGLERSIEGQVTKITPRLLSGATGQPVMVASPGAQANVIETVKVNGTALVPDGSKAVDVQVPEHYGRRLSYASVTGRLDLYSENDSVLSHVDLPRKGLTSALYSPSDQALTLRMEDGTTVEADLSAIDTAYAAGNGLQLANGAFSLTSSVSSAISAATAHIAEGAEHVSAADRALWNGVADAVKTSGDQTVGGRKTFNGTVIVPTPTASTHAATKAYVDQKVAQGGGGGGGGGGVEYTAGAGLTLEGTEFSLDSETQATLAGSVQTSGTQTVAGVKTFTSSPIVPAPTSDTDAATKKYVDDQVSAKAADNAVVHTSGAETIAGVKTFSSSPIVPTPTGNTDAATKKYVDDQVSTKANDSAVVKLTGDQTVGGVKTFNGTVIVPTPTADAHPATKAYVDTWVETLDGEAVKLQGNQTIGGYKTFSISPTVPAPSQDTDAATKKYVDDSVSGKADDSAVVKLTGAQSIAGIKTFTSLPIIPTTTPTSNAQVASKGYVDAKVAEAGGGGGGVTYTAGTGLTLEGTEFSLSTATQGTLSGAVQKTGDETVAGVKTFSSIPVIPTTAPTADGQAASKKYVDDTTSAAVSGLAQDSAVVKLTGAQTVAGVKTFSSIPVIPTTTPTADGQAASKKYVDDKDTATRGYVDSSVSGLAQDSAVAHLSGAETIAGVKTFSSSPIVPTPTSDTQATTKKYVDDAVADFWHAGQGLNTGTEVATGRNIFFIRDDTYAKITGAVQNSGAEEIAGIKTFSSLPVIPTTTPTSNGQAASKKYVDDSVGTKANDSAVVKLTGAQTVEGVKTFSSSPIVPTPTANTQAATKKYVDDKATDGSVTKVGTSDVGTDTTPVKLVAGVPTAVSAALAVDSGVVHNSTDETVAGVKTFSSSPIVPTPTTDYQVATKKYVDDHAGGGGGGSGTWTVLDAEAFTAETYAALFTANQNSGTTRSVTALKDVNIIVAYNSDASFRWEFSFIKGFDYPVTLDSPIAWKYITTSGICGAAVKIDVEKVMTKASDRASLFTLTGTTSTTAAALKSATVSLTSSSFTIANSSKTLGSSGKLAFFVQYRD